jgi:hypothetical protein
MRDGEDVNGDFRPRITPIIPAALTCFGHPDPTAGSPWDKGERLDLFKVGSNPRRATFDKVK